MKEIYLVVDGKDVIHHPSECVHAGYESKEEAREAMKNEPDGYELTEPSLATVKLHEDNTSSMSLVRR